MPSKMRESEKLLSARVVEYLVEMSSGKCSITEAAILNEESPALREIMAGLLYMYEELNYKEQERKRFQHQLIAAKDQAVKANTAKSQFLSRMSHELRTPLNAILGFGQLLQIEEQSNLTQEQQSNIEEIIIAGNHLLELINDVLDLTRIEESQLKVSREKVFIQEAVSESMTLLDSLAQQQRITLINNTAHIHDAVYADFTRLKQVLINLVSNAIKYNRKDGRVTIHCDPAGEARIRICVTDTGNGLTETQIDKVFQPFERLDHDQNIDGAGIGLTISKRLTKLMGGNIGVHSTPGSGSTFWIELPLAAK